MEVFVASFTTLISEVVQHNAGLGWRTGNYVCFGTPGATYLHTQERAHRRSRTTRDAGPSAGTGRRDMKQERQPRHSATDDGYLLSLPTSRCPVC
jgi:hypothetical protein